MLQNKEEILQGGNEMYVVYPPNPKYKDLFDLYNKHKKAIWFEDEIDYSADLHDWEKLNNNEKHFIETILAFFAGSDGIVLDNIVQNFCNEVRVSEARLFYGFQMMIENVHAHTYALLIETYIKDPKRKASLFNAIDEIPIVQKKAQWAMQWMNAEKHTFAERLIAFAIIEGVFFSGAFCAIFWLKDRNLLVNGLGQSNEFISRDEALHVEFAVALYHHLQTKPKQEVVQKMISDAVEIEKEFINYAVPCRLIGMNNLLMSDYIEFVADRLLVQLRFKKIYNTKNPFSFMERIGLDRKANFFETRVTEYQKSNHNTLNDNTFKVDDDF